MRALELWQGDLLSWREPVGALCFSVTALDFRALLDGTEIADRFLVGALTRAGFPVVSAFREAEFRLESSLGLWVSATLPRVRRAPFRADRLICLHDVGWEAEELKHSFLNVFAALAMLEMRGASLGTVLLPLLGAGGLRRPGAKVSSALLSAARTGLCRLQTVSRLVIVERDAERVADVSEGIDRQLRRSRPNLWESALYTSIRDDLLAIVARHHEEHPDDPIFQDLHAELASAKPSATLLAITGRKLAERVAAACGGRGADLAGMTEDLRNRGVPRWIVGYLHVLRQFGNEYGHDNLGTSAAVSRDDIAADLVCMLRVLEYGARTGSLGLRR